MKKTSPIHRVSLDAAVTDLVAKVRLSILVWGPGPSGGAMYVKRCDIRDFLKKEGHDVNFSEDVWTPKTLTREWVKYIGRGIHTSNKGGLYNLSNDYSWVNR